MTCAAAAALFCAKLAAPPSASQVLCWALLLRLAALTLPPLYEDDYYRYLWDGYRTLTDLNPYAHAPSYFFASADALSARWADVLARINYPDVPTIYGPAAQWLYALATALAPAELWPLRVIGLLVDLGVVWALLHLAGARRAMLYALCPLVLYEVGIAAHPDGLIGALLLFALMARGQRLLWLAAVCVGVAAAIKIHALLVLPFLFVGGHAEDVHAKGRRFAEWVRDLALASAISLATYALFWLPFLAQAGAFSSAWQSFATFARDWQFNALGFDVIQWAAGPTAARFICVFLLLAIWLVILTRVATQHVGRASAVALAFAALLFLSPVINPWYLLWLLPLAAVSRWVTPWAAAIVLPLSYLTEFNLGIRSVAYTLPTAVMAIQWVVLALALATDLARARADVGHRLKR